MKCRQCGSEIADKAIVCYKCGTATAEAKFKAPVGRPRKSGIDHFIVVLTLTLLLVFALYMQRMFTVGAPSELRWVVVALALVIVVLRVLTRRRRR